MRWMWSPSSIERASVFSLAAVRRLTLPISRRYMRTGSSMPSSSSVVTISRSASSSFATAGSPHSSSSIAVRGAMRGATAGSSPLSSAAAGTPPSSSTTSSSTSESSTTSSRRSSARRSRLRSRSSSSLLSAKSLTIDSRSRGLVGRLLPFFRVQSQPRLKVLPLQVYRFLHHLVLRIGVAGGCFSQGRGPHLPLPVRQERRAGPLLPLPLAAFEPLPAVQQRSLRLFAGVVREPPHYKTLKEPFQFL